jgi:hypothetical protein
MELDIDKSMMELNIGMLHHGAWQCQIYDVASHCHASSWTHIFMYLGILPQGLSRRLTIDLTLGLGTKYPVRCV